MKPVLKKEKHLSEKPWHAKTKEELFSELQTSESGLTGSVVEERSKKYGENIIKETHRLRPIKIFLQQFNSFLIYILLVASVIMFFLDEYLDATVIMVIVFVNSGIGFFHNYRAEKAILNLKKLIIPKSKVFRDGKIEEIPSAKLVPGDIVVLNEGDRINADCRIIESENLQTNESALTGESLPVSKSPEVLSDKTVLAEQENMLFTGTQVVRGNAHAVVVAIGMSTVFGEIAGTLQEIEISKTPMQKRLDRFSKQLGIVTIILVLIVMTIGIFHDFKIVDMFLTAVALAIGAIPEGLPAVLVIAFAISSAVLSKQNVIIRRLPAVESLGSVTVICSDKTGTITEEKMQVQEIFSNNKFYSKREKSIYTGDKKINMQEHKELSQLFKTSVLCNNARFELRNGAYEILGDPTEVALVSASLDFGLNKKVMIEKEPGVKKFEFDSKRKMMSVARDNGRNISFYSKGAPEKILKVSSFEFIDGQIKKLTEKRKEELLKRSLKMEKDALRVLGFAFKNFSKKETILEEGLIFLGFMGMLDPPRKEVADAIVQCKNAGIKVKIITGDSAVTAQAIAKQVGIEGRIITGEQFEKMNDSEAVKFIDEISIFARTTPHQKLRITKLLQQKGEVVAITGDGINDVLALKSADIGIAMGQRGTDVARDVSDIVLIDDNFASIVQGVKQGRKTYDNIKKFTKYMLAVNFDTILLVAILASLGMPLPILPLQILWKNLITDSFPALTLVFEKDENVMKTKPRKEKSILGGVWKFIIIGGLVDFFACLIVYLIGINQNLSIDIIRTMVVTTGVIFELLFVYVCRSDRPLSEIGFFSNKWMNYSVVGAFGIHLVFLLTPFAKIFSFTSLTASNWILIFLFGISGLIIFEAGKLIRRKILKNKQI